jgi:DNA ligase-1
MNVYRKYLICIFAAMPRFLTYLTLCTVCYLVINKALYAAQIKGPVQLATVYDNENISAYLVSEKYDGFRAIWKNGKLRTRNGHVIQTPQWFTQGLPNVWLDGELWYKRGEFEYVAATVTTNIPIDAQWRHITYMVFDAPTHTDRFQQRASFYSALLQELNIAHIQAVEQFTIESNQALMALLEKYTRDGAEGLMLHKANALFSDGRSGNLHKLKKYMDAEATVIKHLPGKGKYINSMGSLLVEFINRAGVKIQFKIGSGFSDHQRKHPPPIGSRISFAYHGYTKRGLPRFASFMRIRDTLPTN